MEKYIRLATGLLFIVIGMIVPVYITSVYVDFGGSFGWGIVVVYFSLFLTLAAFFFSAVLIGPAFPGIASNINAYGNKFSDQFVRFLFWFGFAGTASKWQTSSGKQATFFDGWFHGLALPFSFILSLFSAKIWMFESNTNGIFYKFGSLIGVFLACLLWLPLPGWVLPAILSLIGVKLFATLIAPR